MSKEKLEDASAQPSGPGSADLKKGKKRKRVMGGLDAIISSYGAGTSSGPERSNKDNLVKTQKGPESIVVPVEDVAPNSKTTTSSSKPQHHEKRQKSKPTPESPNSSQKDTRPKEHGKERTSKKKTNRDDDRGLPPQLLRKRNELLPKRKALPIWSKADSIKAALKKNNVLVLTGETGSGKSTQVPQFLLNEPWCTKCIAITQPRRVAAISLARRVAEEMGSYMGGQSPMAKVGYSVRFDNATGPNTKVKFLTEGMLLQEMLRDPIMSQYSAVVVDEVHERSVNVDLILGFLKNLVTEIEKGGSKRQHPFKVVIMSATADVQSLVGFFDDRQTSADSQNSADGNSDTQQELVQAKSSVSTCFVEGRQFPVKMTYLPSPTQDWVESALKIIFQIHYKEPLPGDILVFLTGQDTIEGLEKLVNDYAEGMDKEVPKVSRHTSSCWIIFPSPFQAMLTSWRFSRYLSSPLCRSMLSNAYSNQRLPVHAKSSSPPTLPRPPSQFQAFGT
jgi:ATP-dependent RNA helicase DHR2